MATFLNSVIYEIWFVVVESSLWLLVGLFLAGLLHAFLPTSFVERATNKRGFRSILNASAIGIPLPLCSCGVIPVAVSLRRKGASQGATASFLVSTPEIGIDSFLLSYGLLGPFMAIVRVVAAFFSALTVGLLVDRWGEQKVVGGEQTHCCAKLHQPDQASKPGFFLRLRQGLRYGYVDLLDDIAPTLTLGLLLAGVVSALLPVDIFSAVNLGPFQQMLLMALIGLPLYVCASASTPLAAALLERGLNPGAAIVFLLLGPATNVATMLVVKRELGSRSVMLYILGVLVIAFIFGIIVGYDYLGSQVFLPSASDHTHAEHKNLFAAFLLLVLMLASLYRRIKR